MVRDVSFRVGRGESFGLVGESGCGKSTIALGIVRYLARNGNVSGGKVEIDGRDVLAHERGRAAQAPPEHGLDGLPGARPGAEPHAQGRAPGGRGVRARRRSEGAGARPLAGDAREGPDLQSGRGDESLSPPAVGRNAPARGDRDGARLGAVAADPRRADDRARRDCRGRGPRSDLGAPTRVRHVVPVHQPQPRRDREDVRPRRRALRGRAGRGGAGAGGVQQPPPSVHGGAAAVHPATGHAQGAPSARHDSRLAAVAGSRTRRLHLRRPLRSGRGPMPHGGASAVRGGPAVRVAVRVATSTSARRRSRA